MKEDIKSARRQVLRLGGAALAMIPVMVLSSKGYAAKNEQMRAAFKYQDKPNGEMACSNCIQFVPGKSAKDKGGCKIFPGDTEISPNGYCTAWVAASKN